MLCTLNKNSETRSKTKGQIGSGRCWIHLLYWLWRWYHGYMFYVQTHQIIKIKYVQFFLYKSYFNIALLKNEWTEDIFQTCARSTAESRRESGIKWSEAKWSRSVVSTLCDPMDASYQGIKLTETFFFLAGDSMSMFFDCEVLIVERMW